MPRSICFLHSIKVPIRTSEKGGGIPNPGNGIVRFVCRKRGRGPPATPHNPTCCGSLIHGIDVRGSGSPRALTNTATSAFFANPGNGVIGLFIRASVRPFSRWGAKLFSSLISNTFGRASGELTWVRVTSRADAPPPRHRRSGEVRKRAERRSPRSAWRERPGFVPAGAKARLMPGNVAWRSIPVLSLSNN
jgi:hypothetical protein